MDVEMMILGFLMSGPKTGYRLKNISGKMLMFYSITLNQIYPALRKLEEGGHIQKEIVVQSGKPNKNVYSITESGRDYFRKKLTAPPVPVDVTLPFLVRVFYFRFLDQATVIQEFEKEIQSIEEQMGDLDPARSNVESLADENGRFVYQVATDMLRTLRDAYSREMKRRMKQ